MAYNSKADVLGFGGAAGGGKSHLILGLAVTQHTKSLIMRREATQLRGLIDAAREILQGRGRLNENTGVWRLPEGRQLEFGGCKDLGDEFKWKGRDHDLLAFDEADEFPEGVVRFLSGWIRTTNPNQRCRCVLTFNPPSSVEGEWVIRFFAPWLDPKHTSPAKPGELRWYAQIGEGNESKEIECPDGTPIVHNGETITPKSRTFIPSRVTDNRYYMETGYYQQLQSLPEPLRSQLLRGDFAVGRKDHPQQMIPSEWVRAAQARWQPHPPAALSAMGVDVARGGKAKTVFAKRHKAWLAQLEKFPGLDTPDGPKVAKMIQDSLGVDAKVPVNIDVIGVGASVYDHARLLKLNAHPINFASKGQGDNKLTDKTGRLEFANYRAWCYWKLREALDPANGEDVCLPPDPEILADLTAGHWEMTVSGVKMEPKEDIEKRLGRSPDCGDAVVLAFIPVLPFEIGMPREGNVATRAPEGVFSRKPGGVGMDRFPPW
jgi:hypothetical protein